MPLLRYDKRKGGSHGRSLTADVPAAGLKAGDRIEPNENLVDIADFELLAVFPVVLIFWRPDHATMTLHRNPIFDYAIGITPMCLTIDILHTLYLGIFMAWCRSAVWFLIDQKVYGPNAQTADELIIVSTASMRQALTGFYKQRHREYPHEELTRVHDLTPKMFGTREKPKLKLSGAETWGFLLFLVAEFARFSRVLPHPAPRFARSGALLVRMHDLLSGADVPLTPAAHQDPRKKQHAQNIPSLTIYNISPCPKTCCFRFDLLGRLVAPSCFRFAASFSTDCVGGVKS